MLLSKRIDPEDGIAFFQIFFASDLFELENFLEFEVFFKDPGLIRVKICIQYIKKLFMCVNKQQITLASIPLALECQIL